MSVPPGYKDQAFLQARGESWMVVQHLACPGKESCVGDDVRSIVKHVGKARLGVKSRLEMRWYMYVYMYVPYIYIYTCIELIELLRVSGGQRKVPLASRPDFRGQHLSVGDGGFPVTWVTLGCLGSHLVP